MKLSWGLVAALGMLAASMLSVYATARPFVVDYLSHPRLWTAEEIAAYDAKCRHLAESAAREFAAQLSDAELDAALRIAEANWRRVGITQVQLDGPLISNEEAASIYQRYKPLKAESDARKGR